MNNIARKRIRFVTTLFLFVISLAIGTKQVYAIEADAVKIEQENQVRTDKNADGNEYKPYTIQEFIAYMQHGYTNYNIFCEVPEDPDHLFTQDEDRYDFRKITGKTTGKIAVIVNETDESDDDEYESIDDDEETTDNDEESADNDEESVDNVDFYEKEETEDLSIAENMEAYEGEMLSRIYEDENCPEKFTFEYISTDDLISSGDKGYDMYVFEESVCDADISEKTFIFLDNLLKKEKKTIVYDVAIIANAFASAQDREGSPVTMIRGNNNHPGTILIYNSSNTNDILKNSSGYDCYINGIEQASAAIYNCNKEEYDRLWEAYNQHANDNLPKSSIYKGIKLEENTPKYREYNHTEFKTYTKSSFMQMVRNERIFISTQLRENPSDASEDAYVQLSNSISAGKFTVQNIIDSDAMFAGGDYSVLKILPVKVSSELPKFVTALTMNRKDPSIKDKLASHIQQVVFPSGINSIPKEAFKNYMKLELDNINLDNISVISDFAFYGCEAIEELNTSMYMGIRRYGAYSFQNTGIKRILISSNVTEIGHGAFETKFPIESVDITLSDNCLLLMPNATNPVFNLSDDCDITIHYDKDDSPIFLLEYFNLDTGENLERIEVTSLIPEQLRFAHSLKYLHGNSEKEEDDGIRMSDRLDVVNKKEVYTVTTWGTEKHTIPYKDEVFQVENGKRWSDYKQLTNYGDLRNGNIFYKFIGWKKDDDSYINLDSVICIDSDINLTRDYSLTGQGTEKKYSLQFWSDNRIKTVQVKIGTKVCDCGIPIPKRVNDTFLGWAISNNYPVRYVDEIIGGTSVLKNDLLQEGDGYPRILYPVFQSDIVNKKITTRETLNGKPIYRNSTSSSFLHNESIYILNQTSFANIDITNAENIKNQILNAYNVKVAILPKGYNIDVKKLQKNGYSVIKTNLELDDYIAALSYINCRYFQYLPLVETTSDSCGIHDTYFKTEQELVDYDKSKFPNGKENIPDGKKDCISFTLAADQFTLDDIPEFHKGTAYYINRDIFTEYYDLCQRMEKDIINISNKIGLKKGMTVTDALWKINDFCVNNIAYDNKYQIYDLDWIIQVTNKDRNVKEANYHGVCQAYSFLVYALCGLNGYEAIPIHVDSKANGRENPENEAGHAITQVIINGKEYYIDYTWNSGSPSDKDQYMFLSREDLIFDAHRNPKQFVNIGKMITYDRIQTPLSITKVTSLKNNANKKMTIKLKKVKNAAGYELQYSTNKKFKSPKNKLTSQTKVTVGKLMQKKTYYVRIRPYKKVQVNEFGGAKKIIKYYGSWSKTKKVKIKK